MNFNAGCEVAHVPYSPASFPAADTTDPFSSQYLVSYCRDVEGLSRRRHSSLVCLCAEITSVHDPPSLPPLPLSHAPLESIHSLACRPLTFLNPYITIRSNRIRRGKNLGIESYPVSIPNAKRMNRREAIVRGVRMLKIVKAGSNGLRKLHTSNKVRGTERSLHAVSLSLSLSLSLFRRGSLVDVTVLSDFIDWTARFRRIGYLQVLLGFSNNLVVLFVSFLDIYSRKSGRRIFFFKKNFEFLSKRRIRNVVRFGISERKRQVGAEFSGIRGFVD